MLSSTVTSMFSKFGIREYHLAELESIFVLFLFIAFLKKKKKELQLPKCILKQYVNMVVETQ